jgi:micrococcal nuclease
MTGLGGLTARWATVASLSALCLAGGVTIAAQGPPAPRVHDRAFEARVVKVVDGDTVDVRRSDGGITRIRIHGIDCPENGRPFAAVARRFTRTLVFDRDVLVAPVDRDRYGRTVARIRVDGNDVSESLIQAGLAWHFRRYSHDPRLDALEREAREAGRGIWRDAAPGDVCPRVNGVDP